MRCLGRRWRRSTRSWRPEAGCTSRRIRAGHRTNTPGIFWGFSEEGFQVLLNPVTDFEFLECFAGLPCSIVPFGHEESMKGLSEQRANLGMSVIAKKTGPSDRRLAWDVDMSEILNTTYPSSRPRGT
jgi:hypothetical protein